MDRDAMIDSDPTISRSEDDAALEGCFSPKKPAYRYVGLALMCFMGFGKFSMIFLVVVKNFYPFLFYLQSCYLIYYNKS